MERKTPAKAFYNDLKRAAELLKTNEHLCREFFNSQVYPVYQKKINDKTSHLRPFFFIFQQLDEHLNNPGARALGQVNKEDILDAMSMDLDADLNEALEIEKSAQGF